jgi:hypothetical protein
MWKKEVKDDYICKLDYETVDREGTRIHLKRTEKIEMGFVFHASAICDVSCRGDKQFPCILKASHHRYTPSLPFFYLRTKATHLPQAFCNYGLLSGPGQSSINGSQ